MFEGRGGLSRLPLSLSICLVTMGRIRALLDVESEAVSDEAASIEKIALELKEL